MKITITEFQRNFRKAREAADAGDTVLVSGESGDYLFERQAAPLENPFAGLEGVFGAVRLPKSKMALREKVRTRLAAKNSHSRRRSA
jgi:hypothetical protein